MKGDDKFKLFAYALVSTAVSVGVGSAFAAAGAAILDRKWPDSYHVGQTTAVVATGSAILHFVGFFIKAFYHLKKNDEAFAKYVHEVFKRLDGSDSVGPAQPKDYKYMYDYFAVITFSLYIAAIIGYYVLNPSSMALENIIAAFAVGSNVLGGGIALLSSCVPLEEWGKNASGYIDKASVLIYFITWALVAPLITALHVTMSVTGAAILKQSHSDSYDLTQTASMTAAGSAAFFGLATLFTALRNFLDWGWCTQQEDALKYSISNLIFDANSKMAALLIPLKMIVTTIISALVGYCIFSASSYDMSPGSTAAAAAVGSGVWGGTAALLKGAGLFKSRKSRAESLELKRVKRQTDQMLDRINRDALAEEERINTRHI